MSGLPPRFELKELITKAVRLGKRRKILIVEGNSDKRFFEEWIRQAGISEDMVEIWPISWINVSNDLVKQHNLNSSERSRILAGAMHAEKIIDGNRALRFVADRDMGQELDRFESPTCLLITDYPAIESYGLSEQVITHFNNKYCRGKLPASASIFGHLCEVVHKLYEFRKPDPYRKNPDYDRGAKGVEEDLLKFDAAKAFDCRETCTSVTSEYGDHLDPRSKAYGHDIVGVLFSVYKRRFKNNLKCSDSTLVEDWFRYSIVDVRACDDEVMFRSLASFLND